MTNNLSYIESLQQQKAQSNARIDAKIARAKTKERDEDTRRKILMGAYMEHKTKGAGTYEQFVRGELDGYLTRKGDRKLFGLPELEEQT